MLSTAQFADQIKGRVIVPDDPDYDARADRSSRRRSTAGRR